MPAIDYVSLSREALVAKAIDLETKLKAECKAALMDEEERAAAFKSVIMLLEEELESIVLERDSARKERDATCKQLRIRTSERDEACALVAKLHTERDKALEQLYAKDRCSAMAEKPGEGDNISEPGEEAPAPTGNVPMGFPAERKPRRSVASKASRVATQPARLVRRVLSFDPRDRGGAATRAASVSAASLSAPVPAPAPGPTPEDGGLREAARRADVEVVEEAVEETEEVAEDVAAEAAEAVEAAEAAGAEAAATALKVVDQEADEQGCKQGDARELSSIMCDRLGSSNGSDEIETEIETEEESSSFQSDEPEAGAPQPPSATPAPSAASASEALPMKIARWSASSLGQLACSQLSSGFLLESPVGPVDVLQLFGLLFVDPSFANALSAQERRLNLKLGEWAEGAAAGGATRSVQYTMRAIKVAGATIVPTCHVVERQVARYDESRGVLVVDCRVTSEGVPYADTFVTCVRYVLTGGQRAAGGGGGGGSSTLQISCAIDWLKAKPGMANVIEKSAVKTMKKTFDKAYRSELDRALSDHAARAAMR